MGQSDCAYDDVQILQAMAQGDEHALSVLMHRHLERVVNFAYRQTGSYEEAEDIAQETFVRAWRAAHRFTPCAAVSTWLLSITARLCLSHSRKWQRTLHRLTQWFLEQPQSVEQTPLFEMMDNDEDARVQAAIQALTPRQRAAINLKHFEGLSQKETAQLLGCTEAAVESLLQRARATLADLLESR